MKNILVIDNYDSFTYNLKQLLENNGAVGHVVRNDKVDFSKIHDYDGIVLSPGPSLPENAGDLKKLIREVNDDCPILGICLGMQAIGEVYDARLRLMDLPMHGISTPITHNEHEIFEGIETDFDVARYHSWVIDELNLGEQIDVIAEDQQGLVMAIQVKNKPVFGFQFHPESILTNDGNTMIINFLNYCHA